MSIQTVYGKGLHLLLWDRMQAAGDKKYNRLNFLNNNNTT